MRTNDINRTAEQAVERAERDRTKNWLRSVLPERLCETMAIPLGVLRVEATDIGDDGKPNNVNLSPGKCFTPAVCVPVRADNYPGFPACDILIFDPLKAAFPTFMLNDSTDLIGGEYIAPWEASHGAGRRLAFYSDPVHWLNGWMDYWDRYKIYGRECLAVTRRMPVIPEYGDHGMLVLRPENMNWSIHTSLIWDVAEIRIEDDADLGLLIRRKMRAASRPRYPELVQKSGLVPRGVAA